MTELSHCRRRIIEVIGDGEATGSELAERLGRIQTNISRDLQILLRAGLVQRRTDGIKVLYSVVSR